MYGGKPEPCGYRILVNCKITRIIQEQRLGFQRGQILNFGGYKLFQEFPSVQGSDFITFLSRLVADVTSLLSKVVDARPLMQFVFVLHVFAVGIENIFQQIKHLLDARTNFVHRISEWSTGDA